MIITVSCTQEFSLLLKQAARQRNTNVSAFLRKSATEAMERNQQCTHCTWDVKEDGTLNEDTGKESYPFIYFIDPYCHLCDARVPRD